MKPSTLLVLNTSATYIRSLLGAGLALFSSRWVLHALGEVDFGLFNLVGSILVFIAFFNSVMANSASRHFAFAIGKGDPIEVNRWFNVSLFIHLCLAIALTVVGWTIGEYVVFPLLNIPNDRMISSLLVFRISLISLFTGMLSIPFVAMFRAKQRIAELSAWDMLHSFLNFLLAWLLIKATGDLLLFYACGITSILVVLHGCKIIRAAVWFKECKFIFRRMFDLERIKSIIFFAFWNLFGSLGALLRDEGSAILLNLYFGPKVNASYGIAKQVARQVGQLANAMLGAFSPEITAREGRGERSSMIELTLRANKFGTLLLLVFLVPLMVEMDYVLKLWLVQPPEYSAMFCRLVLLAILFDRLTSGYMLAVNAYGKIAGYQATLGTILVMTLPLAWFFLYLGFSPPSVGIAFIITMSLCSFGRILWAQKLLNVPANSWITKVLFPCVCVGLLAALAACLSFWLLHASFIRLMLVTASATIVFLVSVWFVALDKNEKNYFYQAVKRCRDKIYNISFSA